MNRKQSVSLSRERAMRDIARNPGMTTDVDRLMDRIRGLCFCLDRTLFWAEKYRPAEVDRVAHESDCRAAVCTLEYSKPWTAR